MNSARLLFGAVAFVAVLWSAPAQAVPICTGAACVTTPTTFTSDSGLVDYTITKNIGFGTVATLPPGSSGFDLVPDLTAFAVFAPTVAQGELDFSAQGVDFGSLVAVINELMFTMAGSYQATGPGSVTILASMDLTSVNGTPTGQPPVGTPTVNKNFGPLTLNQNDTWAHTADWLASEFLLPVGVDPTGVQVSIDVFLTADGFGPANMNEAMAVTDVSLVPDTVVPEPTALLLLGLGLFGIGAARIR